MKKNNEKSDAGHVEISKNLNMISYIDHISKYIRYLVGLLCMMSVILSLTGCGKEKERQKGDDEIYLYYLDDDQTQLMSVIYKPKGTEPLETAKEVIEKMNETSKELNYITAKPESITINDIAYESNVLMIDFNVAYEEMNHVAELLCRSAIVLTVTQLRGIDSVEFTIDGAPVMNSANIPIGRMTASDFVDNGESNINSFREIELVLYFADTKGRGLTPVNYDVVYNQNTSVEKLIIEKLIEGPGDTGYLRTVPSGVRLISVLTKDGICYVNFDSSFLTEKTDVSAEYELYSIVNSLSELSYINKVQISVNGNIDKKLRDEISLEYAFTRNLDIVVEY